MKNNNFNPVYLHLKYQDWSRVQANAERSVQPRDEPTEKLPAEPQIDVRPQSAVRDGHGRVPKPCPGAALRRWTRRLTSDAATEFPGKAPGVQSRRRAPPGTALAVLALLATQTGVFPLATAQPASELGMSLTALESPDETETEFGVAASGGIDINTATAEELAAGLSGIGQNKAQAIIRYREQFGAFESVEELSEVKGIGAATVDRNRATIRLR